MKIQDDYMPLNKKRVWKKPSKKVVNSIKKFLENPEDFTAVSGTITRSIPTIRSSINPKTPKPLKNEIND